jgi:UTP--glucose-1-phosphate uridylyltransferase
MTFLYQNEPSGESDAIGCAGDIAGSHSAAVIYPDNIYFPAPGALVVLKPFFNTHKKDIVALSEVTEKTAPVTGNAGRVDVKPLTDSLYSIERFIPKGPGRFTLRFRGEIRACGISISGPHMFDYINKSRNAHESGEHTDFPVRSLILKKRGMLGCRLPGTVFDIGNPAGYKLCLDELEKECL